MIQEVRVCSKCAKVGCRKGLNYPGKPFAGIDTVVLLLREAQLSSQSVDSRILEIQGTQHLVHEVVAIGRPKKVISSEDIEREFEVFQNWKIAARQLGVWNSV